MSHVLRIGVVDQIAYFRAFDTDGTGKTDLTSATTGLTLSVFRVGLAPVSISSLSDKAADNTTHADGAIRNVGGNLYTVDLPDAACATQTPSVGVRGTYTGGVIEPIPHPIVNYDPSLVAVGANTLAPGDATAANQVAILAAVAGGGDATLANQTAILAKVNLITSQTANQQSTPANTLTVKRGDSFTGTHAVTTDYTGYTATFTIRHRVTDAVLCTASAVVTSSTILTVNLTTTDTAFALLVDATEFGPHPYDIQLVSGATQKTESGIVIITRDQTRT